MTATPVKMTVMLAVITLVFLPGGLVLGILVGNTVFESLPGHMGATARGSLAALPAITGIIGGSALWGVTIARLTGQATARRMVWAGIVGFVPITIGMAIFLLLIEPVAIARWGTWLPIHRLFTVLFVPSAAIIAAVGAWTVAWGLRHAQRGWPIAWRVGLSAALAFLAVNLVMDALGWRVGGPHAAERFTMLTVMFMGDAAAALVGGGVLGAMLARTRRAMEHSIGQDAVVGGVHDGDR